ncbi:MAG: DNA-binding response regulator [Anaerolineaceae bacterium]|nr:DNA-binding response regulator [Anaerolineaceae bacterium]
MDTLRVLLADDHALFRQGVKSLLEAYPNIEVVGTVGDGCEAIKMVRDFVPDVVLMDIAMPNCDGLQATRQIKREFPNIKIVILTVADDHDTIFEAIKCGAQGYLLKNLEAHQLFEMLDGLRRGDAPLSGSIAAKILFEFNNKPVAEASFPVREELSERERQVLELIVEGLTNKEIAEKLIITENTVKTYLANILSKLHLHNRIQAAVFAVSQGLVDTPYQE